MSPETLVSLTAAVHFFCYAAPVVLLAWGAWITHREDW
jgi:hypothetical protein